MKISELISKLNTILETEGDLRVTVFDEYTEAEGWDYNREDLWLDASPSVGFVENDKGEKIEKVVTI